MNACYDYGKIEMLLSGLNFNTGTFSAVLLDNTYTFDGIMHVHYSDISAHAIGSPQLLASGYVNAGPPVRGGFNNVTFPSVTLGATVKAIAIIAGIGSGTDGLLLYMDTGTGLPYTGTGASATFQWNSGLTSGDVIHFS